MDLEKQFTKQFHFWIGTTPPQPYSTILLLQIVGSTRSDEIPSSEGSSPARNHGQEKTWITHMHASQRRPWLAFLPSCRSLCCKLPPLRNAANPVAGVLPSIFVSKNYRHLRCTYSLVRCYVVRARTRDRHVLQT